MYIVQRMGKKYIKNNGWENDRDRRRIGPYASWKKKVKAEYDRAIETRKLDLCIWEDSKHGLGVSTNRMGESIKMTSTIKRDIGQ